jgi:hypothetical protein
VRFRIVGFPSQPEETTMPTTDKNKAGGHSHPQKADRNNNDQGDSRKSSTGAIDEGKKGKGPKISYGKSGPKDSH